MLSFLVLGSMELRTPVHTVRVRGLMQQTLLATFLAEADKLIPVDALTEELWGTTPPAKSENALQAQISRLRRSLARLEPDRKEPRVITRASGYQFSVHWSELDAWTFQHTVDAIRARAGADRKRDVAELRAALALWRGPVFGGLAAGSICQTAATKYEESRTAALGLLYELELDLGRHATIVPELTELLAQNPMYEQFCRLLMVALYRTGRQIDALNVYRRVRRRLADEFGMEPSPLLRRYEEAILNHDPFLSGSERRLEYAS
jgi:DNA-binding SARP family transcriptional activator